MKRKHTTLFFVCSFFVAFAIAAIFCTVALVVIAGKEMPLAELPVLFLQTTFITWLYIVLLRYLFEPIVWLLQKCQNLSFKFLEGWVRKTAACLMVGASLYACNGQVAHGIDKDLNTGMVTTYHNLKPAKTILIMNGEELNHTDIPLGESFVVMDKNVEGLTVKNNKVSIGCLLQIKDSKGKPLLNEADLFQKTGGIFEKDNAQFLKCTINTGEPMDWEQEYTILVKFWDKYGQGTIEHSFKIKAIDIP